MSLHTSCIKTRITIYRRTRQARFFSLRGTRRKGKRPASSVRRTLSNKTRARCCRCHRRPHRHRCGRVFFSAFKWVTVDCEPHGIGGADEQVRRETGYWRIEGTRHANPSSRCQQPTLYTHTRPGLGRSCARYTAENMHREQRVERRRKKERKSESESERRVEGRWR